MDENESSLSIQETKSDQSAAATEQGSVRKLFIPLAGLTPDSSPATPQSQQQQQQQQQSQRTLPSPRRRTLFNVVNTLLSPTKSTQQQQQQQQSSSSTSTGASLTSPRGGITRHSIEFVSVLNNGRNSVSASSYSSSSSALLSLSAHSLRKSNEVEMPQDHDEIERRFYEVIVRSCCGHHCISLDREKNDVIRTICTLPFLNNFFLNNRFSFKKISTTFRPNWASTMTRSVKN